VTSVKPYLIFEDEPTTRPVPEGWALKPVGAWGGRDVVVAYDPQRYDVMVTPEAPDDDTFAVQDLRHCGWEPKDTGPHMWQTRVNRRVVAEGTWEECTTAAYEAVAYAHDRASLTSAAGGTTTAGAAALLTFGARAQEDQAASASAFGLSVSVRPRHTRTLWVRDRIEATRAALDRTAHPSAPGLDVDPPGP
jgi:hypothetical protein